MSRRVIPVIFYALMLASVLGLIVVPGMISAQDWSDMTGASLRNGVPIPQTPPVPAFARVENDDIKRPRNYPEQPPTIPHAINKYQLDRAANRCLACHAFGRVRDSGAPMISVTHFMDRDGQFLATVSPRRYFCTQCHVTQTDAKPLVGNNFIDINRLLDMKDKDSK